MPEEDERNSIFETRVERIVSPQSQTRAARIARFLKPCTTNVTEAAEVPSLPLLSEIHPQNLQEWSSKVAFKGWHPPQKRWRDWVELLAPKYGFLWLQLGICDAVTNSVYETRCHKDAIFGLVEFWCPETNTFLFPWGEAAVTLEDVAALGGFPALGEPVTRPPTAELAKVVAGLEKERLGMSGTKSKKASFARWMERFAGEESDLEHAAFLALWLSRYVFPPAVKDSVGKHVFPIAAYLSRGVPVALGPAVLAGLYHDLRVLREGAVDSAAKPIAVLAQFGILQLWAWERFPVLGPKSPHCLQPGEPRAARWQKLSANATLPLVRSAVKLPENFVWRPYAGYLENWCQPSYYGKTGLVKVDSSSLDQDMRSFARFVLAGELVGMDCVEKYMPHRVAMQFGMDQELPADISGFEFGKEHIRFFVPSKSFQPGVSMRYYNWWKESMAARGAAVRDFLMLNEHLNGSKTLLPDQVVDKAHDFIASSEPETPKRPIPRQTESIGDAPPGFHSKVKSEAIDNWDDVFDIPHLVTVSQDRAESDIDVELETAQTISPKTGGRSCCASVASRSKKSLNLSQVSTRSNSEGSHTSIAPTFASDLCKSDNSDDDDDDDDISIAAWSQRLTNAAKEANSSCKVLPGDTKYNETVDLVNADGNGKKRKAPTTTQGASKGKLSNGIGKMVKKEIGYTEEDQVEVAEPSKNYGVTNRNKGLAEPAATTTERASKSKATNGTGTTVKKEIGNAEDELVEIAGPSKSYEGINRNRELAESVARKSRKSWAGGSLTDPIDVDDYAMAKKAQKIGLDKRVQNLEKL